MNSLDCGVLSLDGLFQHNHIGIYLIIPITPEMFVGGGSSVLWVS